MHLHVHVHANWQTSFWECEVTCCLAIIVEYICNCHIPIFCVKYIEVYAKQTDERTTLKQLSWVQSSTPINQSVIQSFVCLFPGKTVELSRKLVSSILACALLCLFPERVRDKTAKLNFINFTNFFEYLTRYVLILFYVYVISKLFCFSMSGHQV